MSQKERGEKIRRQILRDVVYHSEDLAKHISSIFSITPQAANHHIRRLEKKSLLASTGVGKGKKYFLGDVRKHQILFKVTDELQEDRIWREHFAFIFEDIPENIVDICLHGFTEMMNNVIDHSEGEEVLAAIIRDKEKVQMRIIDNGEGIFRRIKRLVDLPDEKNALFELSKGKLTTDPDNHTGEGIFFTSRAFDEFEIESKGLEFSHHEGDGFDFLMDTDRPAGKIGTVVSMMIQRASKRIIREVFDKFTQGPDDYGFNRTVVPMQLAQYDKEKLVSRSQAKRMLARLEKFEYVIFDFKGINDVGQAFADEIFRVYARNNPDIKLVPVHMEKDVSKMVNRAIHASEK